MLRLILVTSLFLLAGCSHSVLVKKCQAVADSDKFVCKVLSPLE